MWGIPKHVVTKQCLRLKTGKAVDAGGWSHEVLRAMVQTDDGAKMMTRLVEHHLNPMIPQQLALHLHAARLVCLRKPGEGHRPIVVESAC